MEALERLKYKFPEEKIINDHCVDLVRTYEYKGIKEISEEVRIELESDETLGTAPVISLTSSFLGKKETMYFDVGTLESICEVAKKLMEGQDECK